MFSRWTSSQLSELIVRLGTSQSSSRVVLGLQMVTGVDIDKLRRVMSQLGITGSGAGAPDQEWCHRIKWETGSIVVSPDQVEGNRIKSAARNKSGLSTDLSYSIGEILAPNTTQGLAYSQTHKLLHT